MQIGRKIICFAVLCILLVSAAIPMESLAAENVNTDAACKLTIRYSYTQDPITGAQFYLYKVGDVNQDGAAYLTGSFAGYPVDTAHMVIGGLSDAAELLYGYALLDQVVPDAVLTIDGNGVASKELPVGLYLVAGQKYSNSNGKFSTAPMLVSLPYRFSELDPWEYEISMEPKCKYTPKERQGEFYRSVMKIWNDEDSKSRPTSVSVSLLRDREVVDTVVLSAENRWTHKWEKLSEAYEWRVVEKPVEGYSVEIDMVLGIYLVTNTQVENPPTEPTKPSEPSQPTEPTKPSEPSQPTEPTKPSEPSQPTEPTKPSEPSQPTEPTKPSEPSQPTEPTKPSEPTQPTEPTKPSESTQPTEDTNPTQPKPEEPKLPQTGMLWWPIPVLLILGVCLICIGWFIRRGEDHAR